MQLLSMVAAVKLKESLPFVILGMVLLKSWYSQPIKKKKKLRIPMYTQIVLLIALFMVDDVHGVP